MIQSDISLLNLPGGSSALAVALVAVAAAA
jgi:hypothetical protein